MARAESKQFPLGRFPYKIAISREELAIGLAHRKETGEPIQAFVRRLIREHDQARGSERFTPEKLALELDSPQAPTIETSDSSVDRRGRYQTG
jgi:hypothetical protein